MKTNRGYTLPEIIIVVAIIGLTAAISIPNFVQAKRRANCISNQQALEHARDAFIKEQRITRQVLLVDICGSGRKLEREPRCPNGGIYTLGGPGEEVTCSLGMRHQRRPR